MEKNVAIYSNKTNDKLCDIKAPQKWWSDLPLPLPFISVSYHTAFKDPEMIRKWAWQQTSIIVAKLNDIGVIGKGELIPPDFNCTCLVCSQDTVKAWVKHWFWSNKFTLSGFACSNRDCSMYKIIIPPILCNRINEIPLEYLPDF